MEYCCVNALVFMVEVVGLEVSATGRLSQTPILSKFHWSRFSDSGPWCVLASAAMFRNQCNVCCITILESSFSEGFSHWESGCVEVGLGNAQNIDAIKGIRGYQRWKPRVLIKRTHGYCGRPPTHPYPGMFLLGQWRTCSFCGSWLGLVAGQWRCP
jgi:hypothetical protein